MRAATSSSSLSMPMAMMPRAITFEKSLSGVFLPCLLGGKENELALFFQIAYRQYGADVLARLQVEQALHGLALARAPTSGIS